MSRGGASAPRRYPTRTCVACRTERQKRELIRIVRTPQGEVSVDPTGRAPGRGAYLCADGACWTKAQRTRALQRALELGSSEALAAILAGGPPLPGAGDVRGA